MAFAATVDQAKLVMNAFAATFQNNLVSAELVQWKQYDSEMNDRNALTVTEQIGPRYAVTQTTSGVANLSSGVQETVFGSEQFTVNQVFGTSMGWDDFVRIRDIGEARESEALKNAAVRLAEVIDGYIVRTAVLASANWMGNPANNLANWDDFVQGYTRLKEAGCDDADMRSVLTYKDKETLGEFVIGLHADKLITDSFRSGFTGEIGGIPTLFSQQLPTLTTGTHGGTPVIDGANQNVNYSAVAVSPSPGRYLTQTLTISGLGSTDTVVAGETFTIAGVYDYDNRLGAALPYLRMFTVLANATAASGVATLTIFPAIVVPGTNDGTSTSTVNTANATVDSIPANSAAITWGGTTAATSASTAYKPRVIMQKQAIVVNSAPLIMPATGKAMTKSLTKVPLTVRMWQNSTFATGEHDVRFDVALTANVRDRRRIVRINGQ